MRWVFALLWDNGSQDDTATAALAVERFEATHLLFLDNDMPVEPGFAVALLTPFSMDERVGQTQAKLRFMDDRLD